MGSESLPSKGCSWWLPDPSLKNVFWVLLLLLHSQQAAAHPGSAARKVSMVDLHINLHVYLLCMRPPEISKCIA